MAKEIFVGLMLGILVYSLGSNSFLCAMNNVDDMENMDKMSSDDEALHAATCMGNAEAVREVLTRNPDAIHTIVGSSTHLSRAVLCMQPKVVAILVEARANVNEANDLGDGLLHMAAGVSAHAGVVEELIHAKAEVNVKNGRGNTPLHTAANWGKIDVARVLVELGADLKAVNRRGQTPLKAAELSFEQNKEAMKQLLMEAEARQRSASESKKSNKASCVVS